MKKLLLILLCLPMIGFGQQTYVPDDNFEDYLEANGMGNGVANDDYVTTANINTVIGLDVNYLSISDLTGIEDFTALEFLQCTNNQLTNLDVSNNTALRELFCWDNNQLTSLDASGATALLECVIFSNLLTSLDVSGATALTVLECSYNQLTSLDVSNNTALTTLWCDNNQLTSLDVSNNAALTFLGCNHNQLTSLDLRNGNNTNFLMIDTTGAGAFTEGPLCTQNPTLSCINVDDSTYSTLNWTILNGNIDPQHYFSNNCSATAIEEHSTNKELLKVIDLLGRETKGKTNEPLFYIYDNGTVEKRIVIE